MWLIKNLLIWIFCILMLQPRHLNNFNHPFNIYVPSAPFVTFHRTSTRPLCFAFGPANLSSQAHAAGLELVTPPRQHVTASSSCSLTAATTLSVPAIPNGAPNQEWEWCFIRGGANKLDGQRKSALATRERARRAVGHPPPRLVAMGKSSCGNLRHHNIEQMSPPPGHMYQSLVDWFIYSM
jgi:hypothetical protein